MIADPMWCSTTSGCALKSVFAKGEKLDQELMSLETLALFGDPLNDDDVLRAASKANELTELVNDALALASV